MTTIDKYKKIYGDKGLSGMLNLGNTCFLNSVMQVLSHTYELNDFLSQKTYITRLNKNVESVLLLEWDKLREDLWKKNKPVSPLNFIKTVHKISRSKGLDTFSGFTQNDTSEFLLFIIDCFHTALSREVVMQIHGSPKMETDNIAIKCFGVIKQMYEKDYSEMLKIFYGTHISMIRDVNDNVMSMTPEPFFVLDLPIPANNKSPTLLDCFELYAECEILDGDNAILDEKTNTKVSAKKNLTFWNFPDVLVIDIKRFNSNNKKNQIMIDCPLENLNLSKYVTGYNPSSFVYDLYGVCNHGGSSLGGHYTATIRTANNDWYSFNDATVTPITEHIITSKAYCLFYRKRS